MNQATELGSLELKIPTQVSYVMETKLLDLCLEDAWDI